jgi:hypothetical protein
MQELDVHYNLYGQRGYAHTKFNGLKQGSMSISDFHQEIYNLVRGMGMTPQTNHTLIKTGYVKALSDVHQQRRLYRKVNSPKDESTLEELMDMTTREGRLCQFMDSDTTSTATAAAVVQTDNEGDATVCAATGDAKPQFKSPDPKREWKPRQNNAVNSFCDIHESSTHNTSDCFLNKKTQCKWCRATVKEGTLGAHTKVCTAPRCYYCNKLGHREEDCKRKKDDESREQAGRGKRYEPKSESRPESRGARSSPYARKSQDASKKSDKFVAVVSQLAGLFLNEDSEDGAEESKTQN